MEALAAMPRYEAYKDSGVDWLGDIPANWQLKKLKFVVDIVKRIAGKEGFDVLSITQQGIKVKDVESGEGQLAMDYSKYQLLYKGEFAMNHMDLLTGYVDLSKFDGVVSPDYRAFRNCSSDVFESYLLLIFQMGYAQRIFYKYGQGVSFLGRWRFPADSFKNFVIPIPPIEEQKAIVNFVDQKTAQINEAIAIKEKQIELLKERKQIIIQKVVTQGLDPNVPMKDSGVDWIGEIPEHWEVVSTRHLSRKITDGEHISPIFTDSGMPFLSAKDIRQNEIIFPENKFVKTRDGKRFRQRCNPDLNDLLLVSRGATIGRVSKVKVSRDFCLLGSVILIKPKVDKVVSDFLLWAFSCSLLQRDFLNTSDFSAQQAIYLVKVSATKLPVPPIREQKEIALKLDTDCSELDKFIFASEEQIQKLKEYKATLINSAVTGKIRVPSRATTGTKTYGELSS